MISDLNIIRDQTLHVCFNKRLILLQYIVLSIT